VALAQPVSRETQAELDPGEAIALSCQCRLDLPVAA
jgi:hypothetical protein